MMEAIDASARRFLASLESIDARAERAQRAISSGLKISTASDAPDQISALLAVRAQLGQTVQIQVNLGRVKAEVDAAEKALENAVLIVERVGQLGLQGATETQAPAGRRTIAVEVGAALDSLVGIAGTQVEGRYVFSGDNDLVAPYAVDTTQPNGVTPYAGAAATREVMHPAGSRFTVSRTAQEIFDASAPEASVFAAVNGLRVALENGPAVAPGDPAYEAQYDAQTAAIDAALLEVRAAHEHLAGQLSFYGTVQDRIAEALDFAHKLELQQTAALSSIQDADLTASVLELNQATDHRDAALASRAQLPRNSLFNYLG